MSYSRRLGWLLIAIIMLQGATAVRAQGRFPDRSRRDYVRIEPDEDLQQALSQQLLEQKQVEEVRRLLAQLGQDPDRLKISPKDLRGVDVNDTKLRKQVEEWLARNHESLKLDAEQMKALKQALKKPVTGQSDEGNTKESGKPRIEPDPQPKPKPKSQPPRPGPVQKPAQP